MKTLETVSKPTEKGKREKILNIKNTFEKKKNWLNTDQTQREVKNLPKKGKCGPTGVKRLRKFDKLGRG